MKKSIIKTVVLAALMALPMFAKAQTFAGITAEQNAQNTPEGWTAVELPQLPTITSANTFNIKDYGASTSAADNTKAIQKALDAVPSTGGMVVIPAGTWMFGSTDQMTSKTEVLSIKSKTVLHLCAGATLKLVEYGKAPNNKTLFIGCKNKNQSDIVIEGEGETSIIDGQGTRWWKARDNKETFNPGAMIRFEKGSRFLIRNLKVQNTPGVNITLSNSNGASNGTVHDVTIYNPSSETKTEQPSHNTDGISIWGHHMNIYNCNISTGDDNVVCDNDAQYIHVWNCDFGTGHGASIGSFTKNIKHVWFDNITMNGTTAGIRMKTGINSDGTLRGGGEEDWKFTNFTMTKVKNPFSIDCFYDKNYNSDPAVDKANARALDSTTPTYNGILLQNVKTTDVCEGNAIFLIGRPESHIKNVTLDNVQISAKKGIDIRFVDNLVFKNNSKITCQSGKLWIRQYDSIVDDQCDATGAGTNPTPNPGETTEVSYILDASTSTSSTADPSPWTFNNGCSIESSKGYATAKSKTIKYSKGVQFTINLPENITITSAIFAGYANEDNKTCYLSELNGTTFASDKYVFPSRLTQTDTSTKFDITLATPATGVLTFTPQGTQAAWVIILKGVKVTSSGINNVVLTAEVNNNNIYDLSGRMVKLNAKAEDLKSLKKGIYIYNNKKYVAK
ncbi:glycoside hydrolase family 28 protein [Segatella copri]|uniref:glycoside hydrolase family 28 protein n=1 Tax=Segatella copri TaxID=165179 RepID=UPI002FF23C95